MYLLDNEGGYYRIEDNSAALFIFKWLISSTYQFSLTTVIMISHMYQKTGKVQ
jgi:hypothetical protein